MARKAKENINADDYYLVSIGKNYDGTVILTSTFHKKFVTGNRRHGVSKQNLNKLFSEIKSLYHYIYIPVESKIHDILSLQSRELQSLMDKSILNELREILDKKEHLQEDRRSNLSLVEIINDKLNTFIEDINSKMSEGYQFQAKGAHKKSIKANDIVKVIIEEYFSIRPLTKENKGIKSLSSGQQRLALIDIATTLLSNEHEKSRSIILAIDEPENSLDSSQRFKQTERIINLAKLGHQTLITTHWYGLLLSSPEGCLTHATEGDPNPKILQFPLQSFFNERKKFPDTVEMKSFFDLASSIISISKSSKRNWIICEGTSDSQYISKFLSISEEKIHVLPFNGKGNIVKLFRLLTIPFEDKNERNENKKERFYA